MDANLKINLTEAASLLAGWIKSNPTKVAEQKEALGQYGNLFRPDNLANLSEEKFKGFLLIKNNKHWASIHRQPNIYADMNRLRSALLFLLTENRPIQERLDEISDEYGKYYIKGLGRAVLTPILLCVYPEKYAVYNRISEEALNRLGRNRAKPSDPFGERYVAINRACQEIAKEINQPLYLVDSMFSLMVHQHDSPLEISASFKTESKDDGIIDNSDLTIRKPSDYSFAFPLEKHLEEFLVSNWDKTVLGKTLELHAEDEESATQYVTDIGEIDILARDKKTRDWVVIELKKGKHSDAVVGQLLRYMGWVKKHKSANGESVRGIIITNTPDDRIKYAMLVSQGISFYTYGVSFELTEEQHA